MKTKFFSILIMSFLGFQNLKAQHDVQINLSHLIFYEFNINYEFKEVIDQGTIGLFGGYVYGLPGEENTEYFNIGSEFRYYVSSKRNANGFFVGLYTRYKNGTEKFSTSESGYSIDDSSEWIYNDQLNNATFESLAVGLNLGAKWITQSNLIFGFNIGLGRNMFYNQSEIELENSIYNQVDPDSYHLSSYPYNSLTSEFIDFRTGFNIGYRFSSKPIFKQKD